MFSVAVFLFVLGLSGYWKLRKRRIEVSCWFCGVPSNILSRESKWWLCKGCHQYNGFNQDGDYNQKIKEMYNGSSSLYQFCIPTKGETKSNTKNLLCGPCLANQSRKIYEMSLFEPYNESNFEKECMNYEDYINDKYKPCLSCRTAVQYHLKEQDNELWALHKERVGEVHVPPKLRKINIEAVKSTGRESYQALFWKKPFRLLVSTLSLWFLYDENYTISDLLMSFTLASSIFICVGRWKEIFIILVFVQCVWFLVWILSSFTNISISYNVPKRVLPSVVFVVMVDICCTIFQSLCNIRKNVTEKTAKMPSKLDKETRIKNAPEVAVALRKRTLEGKIVSTELRAESDSSLTEDKCIQKPGNPENESMHKDQVTPDLLQGHLDAMFIGNSRIIINREDVDLNTDKNHVIAALKYETQNNSTTQSFRRGPLIKPATFLLNTESVSKNSEKKIGTESSNSRSSKTQWRFSNTMEEDYSDKELSEEKEVSLVKSSCFPEAKHSSTQKNHTMNWTLVLSILLSFSILVNVYLYTKVAV